MLASALSNAFSNHGNNGQALAQAGGDDISTTPSSSYVEPDTSNVHPAAYNDDSNRYDDSNSYDSGGDYGGSDA